MTIQTNPTDNTRVSKNVECSKNFQVPRKSKKTSSFGGPNCYVTPAFSGVLKQEDKIRIGYLTPAFVGAHKWAELLRSP